MNKMKRTHSSGSASLYQKLLQAMLMFAGQFARLRAGTLPNSILRDIDEYDNLCRSYIGRSIHDLKVFEIGYGARPYRLITMISFGIAAEGVDLDAPLLSFRVSEFLRIYRNNGIERLVKSMVRLLSGDIIETRQIRRMIESKGRKLVIPRGKFRVGDAADVLGDLEQVDLFVSEDVFEHIPPEDLERLVDQMAQKLSPDGLAIIRPNIFTGITGGHRVEWFQDNIGKRWCAGWSEPWSHLRGEMLAGDTYLNRLTREDYRKLFRKHFEILRECPKLPNLGASYLTDAVARELKNYSHDELFSNQVLFVLKKRTKTHD